MFNKLKFTYTPTFVLNRLIIYKVQLVLDAQICLIFYCCFFYKSMLPDR